MLSEYFGGYYPSLRKSFRRSFVCFDFLEPESSRISCSDRVSTVLVMTMLLWGVVRISILLMIERSYRAALYFGAFAWFVPSIRTQYLSIYYSWYIGAAICRIFLEYVNRKASLQNWIKPLHVLENPGPRNTFLQSHVTRVFKW